MSPAVLQPFTVARYVRAMSMLTAIGAAVQRYGLLRAGTKIPRSLRRRALEYARERVQDADDTILQRAGLAPADVLLVRDPAIGPQIIRKQTSDWPTFQQVFNQEDYGFDHPPIRTILDLGANVGYSAVYYHRRFPEAAIAAVEPSPANVAAAVVNLQLARAEAAVTVVQSAIWHTAARLKITNPEANAWAFRVAEAEPGDRDTFAARTVPDLMRQLGWARINLVKVDIEAAERFLFSTHTEWLASVDEIVIELHDRFTAGCRSSVIAALHRDFGPYEELTRGENTLFRRMQR